VIDQRIGQVDDAHPLSLVYLDIKHFGRINEQFGYRVGDAVLRHVGQRLRKVAREKAFSCRTDSDRFAILLEMSIEDARVVAESVRETLTGEAIIRSPHELVLEANFAVVQVTSDMISTSDVLTRVEAALRRSKSQGKNAIATAAPTDWSNAHRTRIISSFLEKNAIITYRQPIVNVATGRIVGYEFLSRPRQVGVSDMGGFFVHLWESGHLTTVDRQCFFQSAAATADLPNDMICHLNLFPATLAELGAKGVLERIPANRSPAKFCIEIAHQEIAASSSYFVEALAELREAGIPLALDESGFESIGIEDLLHLRPTYIKIDRRFIRGAQKDPVRLERLGLVVNISRAIGAIPIPEGIECNEDLSMIQKLEIEFAQGYLWGPPQPHEKPAFSRA